MGFVSECSEDLLYEFALLLDRKTLFLLTKHYDRFLPVAKRMYKRSIINASNYIMYLDFERVDVITTLEPWGEKFTKLIESIGTIQNARQYSGKKPGFKTRHFVAPIQNYERCHFKNYSTL